MAWTQAFSCGPSCICLILTRAWFGALFRVCLHAYYPAHCLFFCPPQDMCICMLRLSAHHRQMDCSPPPPEGMRIEIQRRPESPFTCFHLRSSLDQYLSTYSSV